MASSNLSRWKDEVEALPLTIAPGQFALDPQVIQLKFNDGRIPGKEPKNVADSDVKRSNPSIVSLSPDNHLRGLLPL